MRDENYYREKQSRIDQKTIPTIYSIIRSARIKQRAVALISAFFAPPEVKVKPRGVHTRPVKERLMRRYRHACRMRNAA
jgi:hypothetical protein